METPGATATEPAGGPAASPGATGTAIRLRGIVKRFPGVVANDGIDLTVGAGSIHAIVGENGAGKSTLMKILYGMQSPDEGTIEVFGEQVHFRSPKEAIALGIGMVHQHFMLADNFTVLENVVLGSEPTKGVMLSVGQARKRIDELAERYGLDVDPDELVEVLGVGERQRVEILKVLYRGARILILDEPTAVLVPQEVDELFDSLRGLTAEGDTVIFISHKLDEVLTVADAITVIRAGKTVAEIDDPSSVTARQLAELMVGSELPTPETRESTVTDVVELDAEGLTVLEGGRAALDNVSLRVRRGEIVGVAGVEGNGQSELLGALLGTIPLASGRIVLAGDDITRVAVRPRRELGVGFIPEDRHRDGLLLPSSLWENSMLGHQTREPNVNGFWIDRKGARRRTDAIVEEYDVRTPGIEIAARALSGGNQQKLVVGREILASPTFLIAAHPTRGIDVGAQARVWDDLREARKAGLATLLISADLDELIGLSDTLLVLYGGKVVAELDPSKVTPADLGAYMTGAHAHERAQEASTATGDGNGTETAEASS
jgi:simple sugar transport system ATP-binding protein